MQVGIYSNKMLLGLFKCSLIEHSEDTKYVHWEAKLVQIAILCHYEIFHRQVV